ncbi:MAG: methyltransferase domain-containing protein, partial [Rhodobacterales bacterium]|nr:methyltransferase domain-containing protein [Rhodobacterales bacterium]
WNARYEGKEYLFGTDPAEFVVRAAAHLPDGAAVLCVADGEGRNSTYLAGLGHAVTAFDAAEAGVAKARRLADRAGVQVAHHIAGVEDWDWSVQYDAVVGIFIQFAPPDLRDRMFGWMGDAVRPGGLLLLHGYAPRQVGYGTGGPGNAAQMYTTDLLRAAYPGWDILHLQDYDATIEEGPGHSGRSALVDLVARKPAA